MSTNTATTQPNRLCRIIHFFLPLKENSVTGESIVDEEAFYAERGKYANRTAAAFALVDGTAVLLDFGPHTFWAWALMPLGAVIACLFGATARLLFDGRSRP
ncbi:MAG: hypothetical protein ACYDEV_03000 [Acidiferrobacter sp.]